MEFIRAFFDWYQSMGTVLSPTLLIIFLLGLMLGTIQLSDDKILRSAVIVIAAFALFGLSFITTDFGKEAMLNLAVELLTALLAVLIVTMASQLETWVTPLAGVGLLALLLVFFVNPEAPATSLPGTFATGLIGAYLAAWLIREEWSWSPQNQRKRMANDLRALRQKQEADSAEFGDYYVMMVGNDPAALEQRISFLTERDLAILKAELPEKDPENELYYQLVRFKIDTVVKDQDTLFLTNNEARVRVIGFPDTVKRVYGQIAEVLEARDRKRIDSPGRDMLHVEFKTDAPQKLYSAQLEEAIFELAQEWRHGDDAALNQATDDLLAWATNRGLIDS